MTDILHVGINARPVLFAAWAVETSRFDPVLAGMASLDSSRLRVIDRTYQGIRAND
jgi:hypothetical protein